MDDCSIIVIYVQPVPGSCTCRRQWAIFSTLDQGTCWDRASSIFSIPRYLITILVLVLYRIPYSVLLGQSLFDIRYPKIITTGTVSTSTGSPGAGYFWPELVKRDRLRLRPQLLQLLSIAFLNFKILIFLGSKNKF